MFGTKACVREMVQSNRTESKNEESKMSSVGLKYYLVYTNCRS